LRDFLPLAQVSGVQLVNLSQSGAEQSAKLESAFEVFDPGRPTQGESELTMTAAIIQNLDLVVTEDTEVAHLAGALGVPVWLMLPLASNWRWLAKRDDSPWYPTMRLFRQRERGDWAELIARVADALRVQMRVRISQSSSTFSGDKDFAASDNRLGSSEVTDAVASTVIVPSVYGQILVNRHDINQTNALFKTGRAIDHNEIVMLTKILQQLGKGLTVLDVGANFGTYTLAFARAVGSHGKVHAFEPQRLIYELLVGSVAINSLANVYCHHVALGDREDKVEVPQYDYNQPMNFGSIEFAAEQSEQLTQVRGHDPAKIEYVPLTTIDSFNFSAVHLVKIDAEGMETQILQGSVDTIRRCRPVLFVEYLKGDREGLRLALQHFGYDVYPQTMNFLCIPTEMKERIQIPPRLS
jgi:FkbM family methyltransferase